MSSPDVQHTGVWVQVQHGQRVKHLAGARSVAWVRSRLVNGDGRHGCGRLRACGRTLGARRGALRPAALQGGTLAHCGRLLQAV